MVEILSKYIANVFIICMLGSLFGAVVGVALGMFVVKKGRIKK